MNSENDDRSPIFSGVIVCPVCESRHAFEPFFPYYSKMKCQRCASVIDTDSGSNFINYWTVGDWRRQQKVVSDELAVRLVGGVCRTLIDAHGRGITHGQLCPSLVYVSRDDSPWIRIASLDGTRSLGRSLSAVQMPDTAPQLSIELLWCMAPELFLGNYPIPQPASDVFSLGVLLWYVTCGTWPSTKAAEILNRRFTNSSHALGHLDSESLNTVFQKATTALPSERFPSAAEMYDALCKTH